MTVKGYSYGHHPWIGLLLFSTTRGQTHHIDVRLINPVTRTRKPFNPFFASLYGNQRETLCLYKDFAKLRVQCNILVLFYAFFFSPSFSLIFFLSVKNETTIFRWILPHTAIFFFLVKFRFLRCPSNSCIPAGVYVTSLQRDDDPADPGIYRLATVSLYINR